MKTIEYVITPYNRDRQTYNTLMRLSKLTMPDKVTVVDDGSNDNLKQFLDLIKYPINYIRREKDYYDGCVIPRNIAIKQSDCDYLLIGDPEVLWVTEVVAQMRQQMELYPEKVIVAGSCYFTSPDTNMDEWLLQSDPRKLMETWDLKQFPFHDEDRIDKDGNPVIFDSKTVTFDHKVQATFCFLVKREWILEIGGYDENFSISNGGGGWGFDDVDLLMRLAWKGHHQIGIPEIEVIHQYHKKGPQSALDGWKRNEELMLSKKITSANSFDLIANRDREWGILK